MSGSTRRNFLKKAGVLGALPLAGQEQGRRATRYRQVQFAAPKKFRQLSENLWLFEDTCNVYVVRDGEHCVLIDFGSGQVLEALSQIGVKQVDWILHTHHHRDQCQGDWKAVEQGIPIAVPAHERHLFEDVENFWGNRRIFHLYYVRNDFYTLTESVPVARGLEDYSSFEWRGQRFFVLPTPGHTLGSITLIATIDGRKVAFSGDLMYAPGKILTLYDTQINYGGTEGIDLSIYSLAQLREHGPELLCPSHGEPLASPDEGIVKTVQQLSDYYRFWGNEPHIEGRPLSVSPHLVAFYQTTSSFYAIISDSGRAMFIDYGSASPVHFGSFERATPVNDRIRFVEHSIGYLKQNHGMKKVDVAMPSHIHDDHMNGFPHLIRRYGTQIWCYENMAEIFANPRGYNLGCLLAEPFKVTRTFRHGERFRWEEFEFEILHSPGHTEYQMALFVTIDGQRVAFTGDAFFENPRREGTLRHNLIFRNHVENDSHLKSIRNLIEREPQVICPGHGRPFAVDRKTLLATEQKLRRQQQFFFDLLPEGETDFGLDPSWVKIYPYQILMSPGSRQVLEIRAQNYYPEPMKLEVALVTPAEWQIEPAVARLTVPAKGHARAAVSVSVPADWEAPNPRFAIAADVVRNGKYLGQITEAVVDLVKPAVPTGS